MSERYPRTNTSGGFHVFSGNPQSGNALDYLWEQTSQERQQEHKGINFRMSDGSNQYLLAEARFYMNPRSTPALEAAVLAIQKHTNEWKEKHDHEPSSKE